MIPKKPLKLIIILLLVFTFFSYLNMVPGFSLGKNIMAKVFGNLSIVRKTIASINTTSNLTKDKIRLEEENLKLLSRIAELEYVQSENVFLKNVIKISDTNKSEFILGNIYTWTLGPKGYTVLLNKGSNAGVAEGDIAITGERVLVGVVSEVHNNFSKILPVTDPKFKATARIVGMDTAGIVTGALREGLHFELIVQEDQITEGDTVVTSGNDIFPDSLIIGKVSQIKFTEGQIFKEVVLEPSMARSILDSVLILKP